MHTGLLMLLFSAAVLNCVVYGFSLLSHLFMKQVMREVTSFLKMLDEVYGIFGLDYTMALSTRPESYLGACRAPTAHRGAVRCGVMQNDCKHE